MKHLTVDVVIPALNEEAAIGRVIDEIPKQLVRHIVVADNGSQDATAEVAKAAGAIVVEQPERGYGAACLKALEHLRSDPPDAIVFLDGDHSDYPSEMSRLIGPLERDDADMVIGSRVLGGAPKESLTPQQRVGNAFASSVIRYGYGVPTTDLGPFRSITWSALESLSMVDRNYGWTVEMQVKAARHGLRVLEVPVSYRERIGVSKVSGTIRGTLGASRKILWLLARYAVS